MTFGEFFWSFVTIYLIFFYFITLFRILTDLFTDPEPSGWVKAGWIIFLLFLPILSILVYLIARGRGMADRGLARAEQAQASEQDYIRQVAGSDGRDPAGQIAKGQELLASGAITQAEFDAIKAKALA